MIIRTGAVPEAPTAYLKRLREVRRVVEQTPWPSASGDYLLVVDVLRERRWVELTKEEVVVGRSGAADVRVSDQWVSEQHCVLTRDGATWRVTDLGAKNGLYVNGNRLPTQELAVGDVMQLGHHSLVFLRVP